jgi:hypothetical protein
MVPGVGLWAHRRPRPLPWQRRRWTPQRSPEPRCWYWWEQAGYEARFTSWAFGHSAEEAARMKSKPQWRSNPSPSWLAV